MMDAPLLIDARPPAIELARQAHAVPQSVLGGTSPVDFEPVFSITVRSPFSTISVVRPSSAASRLDEFFESSLAELKRYQDYARGWDGYDGDPFSASTLRAAQNLIEIGVALLRARNGSPSLITTGPASDGTLDVEFIADVRRLIITVGTRVDNYAIYAGHDEWSHSEVDLDDVTRVVRWISWMAGSGQLPPLVVRDLAHS